MTVNNIIKPNPQNVNPRAALYTRVSSQEQAQHGVSLAEQKERLESWAKVEDWEIAGIYADEGYSGGTDQRPELVRLMEDARAGLFDLVAVTKIDRFFRNTRQLLNYIHELESMGIRFVAQNEGIDTSKPGIGKVLLSMLGSVAEWERDRIGNRVSDFRAHLKRKGQWSSGRTPFGYRFNKAKKELEIDPLEAESVRFIFKAYKEGEIGIIRTAELANKEGVITPRPGRRQHTTWTQSAIRHVLTHPAYKGGPSEDWPFTTPAIITPQVWDAAQNQLSQNRHFRECKERSPFQGLLRCGICGHTLRTGYNHATLKMWECPGRLKRLHLDGSPRCSLPRFKAEDLEKELSEKIVEIFSNPDTMFNYIEKTIEDLNKEKVKLERKLKPIQGNIDRVKEAMSKADTMYQLGRLSADDYRTRIKGLQTRIREYEQLARDADPMLLKQLRESEKLEKYYQQMKKWADYKRKNRGAGLKNDMDFFGELSSKELEVTTVFKASNKGLTWIPESDKWPDWAIVFSKLKPGKREAIRGSTSNLLRKLGLYAYVFPRHIELKGAIRTTNITPGYSEDTSIPLSITLEMAGARGGGR